MGLKTFLDSFTRGRPQREPPTPYSLMPKPAGLGIGVSNYAFQRSHSPMLDSYRGRQGIQVLRNINVFEGGAVISKPGVQIVDVVALAAGVNDLPGYTPLFNPKG